jgi:DedD protein
MATASPEASEIRRRGRQRLIGAIALVVVLVVFVPMVLDSEPRKASNQPLAIPSKENATPLPAPAAPKIAPVAAKVDTPKLEAPKSEAPKADAPKAAPAPVVAAAPSTAPAPKADAPKLEGFAVQVGAFRDEAKLKQAREKLASAGVVHYTERLESQGGPLTRLRAGPFATREAAEAAQATLKRAALDGKVVPLP